MIALENFSWLGLHLCCMTMSFCKYPHRAAASNSQGPAGLQGMHPVNSPLFRFWPCKPQLARTVTWHPDTFHRETHLEVFYKNLSQLDRKPSAPLLLLEEGLALIVWVSGRAAWSANHKFWHNPTDKHSQSTGNL